MWNLTFVFFYVKLTHSISIKKFYFTKHDGIENANIYFQLGGRTPQFWFHIYVMMYGQNSKDTKGSKTLRNLWRENIKKHMQGNKGKRTRNCIRSIKQPDIITTKIQRLIWIEHVERMAEVEQAEQIVRPVPFRRRTAGRSKLITWIRCRVTSRTPIQRRENLK